MDDKPQEYIDNLIIAIDNAEDESSVTNTMVAAVLDHLNKKCKEATLPAVDTVARNAAKRASEKADAAMGAADSAREYAGTVAGVKRFAGIIDTHSGSSVVLPSDTAGMVKEVLYVRSMRRFVLSFRSEDSEPENGDYATSWEGSEEWMGVDGRPRSDRLYTCGQKAYLYDPDSSTLFPIGSPMAGQGCSCQSIPADEIDAMFDTSEMPDDPIIDALPISKEELDEMIL